MDVHSKDNHNHHSHDNQVDRQTSRYIPDYGSCRCYQCHDGKTHYKLLRMDREWEMVPELQIAYHKNNLN